MTRQIEIYGATVRGPLHRRERRPNEDAWLRAEGRFGSLAVVCDGMGSKPLARDGARAACQAVKEAAARWTRVEGAPVSYLAHLVEVFWRLRLHPLSPADAATTCLLALFTTRGTCVIGGVGDGLAFVRTGDELRTVIGERGEGFGNETVGLGRVWGRASVTMTVTGDDLIAIQASTPNSMQAFMMGTVQVDRDMGLAMRPQEILSDASGAERLRGRLPRSAWPPPAEPPSS